MYCDFSSEPGWAWTLVMSQSLSSRSKAFAKDSFLRGPFENQQYPNWENYRIGNSRMNIVRAQSSHWRVTCDFPSYGVDYRDYVRVAFEKINTRSVGDAEKWNTSTSEGITVQNAKLAGGKQTLNFWRTLVIRIFASSARHWVSLTTRPTLAAIGRTMLALSFGVHQWTRPPPIIGSEVKYRRWQEH